MKAIVQAMLPKVVSEKLLSFYRTRVREPYLRCRTWMRCRRLNRYQSPRRLELGPGTLQPPPGWLTLDLYWTATFFADLRNPLPFPDASFQEIYCSHVFEHFSLPELHHIFAECYRILAPDGTLDVVVPNAGLYVRAYQDDAIRQELMKHIGLTPDFKIGTRIDIVNHMAHMCGEHKFLFDEDNLVALMRHAGFSDVHLRPFDEIREHPSRRFESICAIGRRAVQS